MTSTTAAETLRRAPRRALRPVLVIAFWLAVWQVAVVAVDQEILLVSPVGVVTRLAELVATTGFWGTVAHSLVRIAAGFLAAAVVGTLAAALAASSSVVDALLSPLVTAVRSTPVVSFIILVLVWAQSSRLALVISFLMVVPIMFTTVREGIRQRDAGLLDVARVFRVPLLRRLPAIDVPAVLPYFIAGCQVGIGLAWKSGIAAEVIGLPQGSIGEQLYQAKIFLSTADLFAWTVVIVAVSYGFERVVLGLLRHLERQLAVGRAA